MDFVFKGANAPAQAMSQRLFTQTKDPALNSEETRRGDWWLKTP